MDSIRIKHIYHVLVSFFCSLIVLDMESDGSWQVSLISERPFDKLIYTVRMCLLDLSLRTC